MLNHRKAMNITTGKNKTVKWSKNKNNINIF